MMYCALRVVSIYDGYRFYGSTLPYTILDVVVLLFTTSCAMLS
jgi:hypothetical protein